MSKTRERELGEDVRRLTEEEQEDHAQDQVAARVQQMPLSITSVTFAVHGEVRTNERARHGKGFTHPLPRPRRPARRSSRPSAAPSDQAGPLMRDRCAWRSTPSTPARKRTSGPAASADEKARPGQRGQTGGRCP